MNAGYFGQRLRPYLAGNQQALDDLNHYRRQKWLFLAERLTFVGAIATYGAQTLSGNADKPQYFSDPQKVTLNIAAGKPAVEHLYHPLHQPALPAGRGGPQC